MAFSHMFGEETGICLMKFDVADQHGNRLIDQTFLITILGESDMCVHDLIDPPAMFVVLKHQNSTNIICK